MAKVTRSKRLSSKRSSQSSRVTLPTKARVPVTNWRQYVWLIYGTKKIGKTSMTAATKGALVIQCDKEQLALPIKEMVIDSWKTFLQVKKLLSDLPRDDFPYPVIVIDGVDDWFTMCKDYSCAQLGITHPSDIKWGKGWDAMKQEYNKAVNFLLNLPCGLFFIAHDKEIEMETHDGETINRIVPALSSSAGIVNGKVDGWFNYRYKGSNRILVVAGSESVDAGHRVRGRFFSTDGRPIKEIYMGKSEEEAFQNFVAGFNNELPYITLKEYRQQKEGGKSTARKKVTKKAKKTIRKS